jgi:hypothetical protein
MFLGLVCTSFIISQGCGDHRLKLVDPLRRRHHEAGHNLRMGSPLSGAARVVGQPKGGVVASAREVKAVAALVARDHREAVRLQNLRRRG